MEILIHYLEVAIVPALLFLAIFVFGTYQGTEFVKRLSKFLGDKSGAAWLQVKGYGSYIVALALAVFMALGFDMNMFEPFGLEFNPEVLKVFSGIIGALLANKYHDKG
jgi:uncharacterized membrane protein YkvI